MTNREHSHISPNAQASTSNVEANPFFSESSVPSGPIIDSQEDVPPSGSRPNFTDALTVQDVEDRKADRALRDKFGEKAYKVVRKCLYGWGWLLAIYAALKFRFNTEIFSDNVLIAITSAVTLNVFAAFLGVIRGLFPSQKPSKD